MKLAGRVLPARALDSSQPRFHRQLRNHSSFERKRAERPILLLRSKISANEYDPSFIFRATILARLIGRCRNVMKNIHNLHPFSRRHPYL